MLVYKNVWKNYSNVGEHALRAETVFSADDVARSFINCC